jgi:hypothetical protein
MNVKLLRTISGDTRNITIPLQIEFKPLDKWELIENLIEQEKQKGINKIIDWDLWDYPPLDIDDTRTVRIQYRFFWNINGILTDNFREFLKKQFVLNNIDLLGVVNKNFYKRSFIRLNFYDKPNSFDQKLLFTEDLFLTDVFNSLEIPTNQRFIIRCDETKNGYFLNWLKNDLISDGNIYMKPTFFNAKNGRTYDVIKYQGSIIDINTLNSDYSNINYTKYILNKNNLTYKVDGLNYDLDFQYNRLD